MAGLQPLSIEKAPPSARSSSRWGSMDQVICLLVFMSAAAILIMMLDYHRLDGTLGLWPAWDQPEFFQPSPSEALRVRRTVVRGAVEKGAVCLDGSAPSYHIHKGRGFGRNNWLVHLEGGGWCTSNSSCLDRSRTRLGSSTFMEETVIFGGILSDSPTKNPDFYNWNRVKVRYCDGGSLSGERDAPMQIKDGNTDMEKVLYFRGQRIWRAVLADLLSKGMIKAEKALLSGCSAGGLASILHCDDFQSQLPKKAVVKCMSDAGFFLDVKDVKGNPTIQSFYKGVVSVHGISTSLPQSCRSERDVGQCFFPQYLLKTIKTPLFILNPAYDTWQIDHILVPVTADPSGSWEYCKDNPASCSHDELKILQGFRVKLLEAIGTVEGSTDGGLFVNSCFVHCQSEWDQTWHGAHAPRVKGRTIAETVGDWYYHRRPAKDVDCAYPCNPSCFNNNFRTSSPVH